MKMNRLMQERIRRVTVLLKELGFELDDSISGQDTFSAVITDRENFEAEVVIDGDSKFLELAYTFAFGSQMANFLRERLEDVLHALYEFGCYFGIHSDTEEITLTIFSKIYFAGLNYFALKETIRDFREAQEVVEEIFSLEIPEENTQEEEENERE
jgi:hypothetical protein